MVKAVQLSLLLSCTFSLHIFSMTMIVRSSMECPGRLKWAATGFSIFLVLTSDLWPLRQMCKVFSVSLTYCLLHIPHSIRYTRLLILQVAAVRILNDCPVTVLWNVSVALMGWDVLQRLMLHAQAISILPGVFGDRF